MFNIFLQRTLIPTFKISLSAVASSKQCSTISCRRNVFRAVAPISSASVQTRWFSVQTTPEKLVVDFEEVKKSTSNNAIYIIDVREPDEIKEHGKVPNSINIPLGDVTKVLSSMPEKEFVKAFNRPKPSEDIPIIFYCMSGKRSGMAQQNAINLGYKNVKNYLGSWTDWASKLHS